VQRLLEYNQDICEVAGRGWVQDTKVLVKATSHGAFSRRILHRRKPPALITTLHEEREEHAGMGERKKQSKHVAASTSGRTHMAHDEIRTRLGCC
jgi:hypothetical protein